jgi:hypothetical protein
MKLKLLLVILLITTIFTKRRNQSKTSRIRTLEKSLAKERLKVKNLTEKLKSINNY